MPSKAWKEDGSLTQALPKWEKEPQGKMKGMPRQLKMTQTNQERKKIKEGCKGDLNNSNPEEIYDERLGKIQNQELVILSSSANKEKRQTTKE